MKLERMEKRKAKDEVLDLARINEDKTVAEELSVLKFLKYSHHGDIVPVNDNLFPYKDVTLLTNGVIKLKDDKGDIYYIAHYNSFVNFNTILGTVPNAVIIVKDKLEGYNLNKALIITGEKIQFKREGGVEVHRTVDVDNLNNFNNLKMLIKAFHGYKSNPKKISVIKDIVKVLTSVINNRHKGECTYENHVSVKINFGHIYKSDDTLKPIHKDDLHLYASAVGEFIPSVDSSMITVNTVGYSREDVTFINGLKVKANDVGEDVLGMNRGHRLFKKSEDLDTDRDSTRANLLYQLYSNSRSILVSDSKPDIANGYNLVDVFTNKRNLKAEKTFKGSLLGNEYNRTVELSLKTFNSTGCYKRNVHNEFGWFFILKDTVDWKSNGPRPDIFTEVTTWALPIDRISLSLLTDKSADEYNGEFTIDKLARFVYETESESCLIRSSFSGDAISKIKEIKRKLGKSSFNGTFKAEVLGFEGIEEFLKELKKYFFKEEEVEV